MRTIVAPPWASNPVHHLAKRFTNRIASVDQTDAEHVAGMRGDVRDGMDRDAVRAALAARDDNVRRLVYADWLEERGEAERAQFIRLACAGQVGPQDLTSSADPAAALTLLGFGPRLGIPAPPPPHPSLGECVRGLLIGEAEWPPNWSLSQLAGLFARHPLTGVRVPARLPVGLVVEGRRRWYLDAGSTDPERPGVVVHQDAFDLAAGWIQLGKRERWGQVVDEDGRRRMVMFLKKNAYSLLENLGSLATDVIRAHLEPDAGHRPTAGRIF